MDKQTDVNRTCRGLKLLSSAEISTLVNFKRGYLRHHLYNSPQTHKAKKTLVLDIDHTILFVTHWLQDVRFGDVVFDHRLKELGTISKIVVRLSVSRNEHTISINKIISDPNELLPEVGDRYPFSDKKRNQSKIKTMGFVSSVSVRNIFVVFPNSDMWFNSKQIQTRLSPHLHVPSILEEYNTRRPKKSHVSFSVGCVLVRTRPHLAKFLFTLNQHYNIILFTAAARLTYSYILKYLNKWLHHQWYGDNSSNMKPIWSNTYFREDCNLIRKNDQILYSKNIAKLGIDLSQIVIVDDSHHSFRGFEPNAIRIGRFSGSTIDDQLLRVLHFLLKITQTTDVRYYLCDLKAPLNEPSEEENEKDKPFMRSLLFLSELNKKMKNTLNVSK